MERRSSGGHGHKPQRGGISQPGAQPQVNAPPGNRGMKARYISPVQTRYIALSALDPWFDSYLGLAPQAEICRPFGACTRGRLASALHLASSVDCTAHTEDGIVSHKVSDIRLKPNSCLAL